MNYKEMLEKARKSMPKISVSTNRFEVPYANIIIQGKKTIITNFNKIADYIHREMEDIVKFLGKELATSIYIDSHKAVLTGKFNQKQLNEKIKKYVNLYVKCSECGRFETKLKKDNRITYMECMACGARKPVRV